MIRRRIQYRGDRIEKRYLRDDLLVDDETLDARLRLIEAVTAAHVMLPTTQFSWDDDTLMLTQVRIRPVDRPTTGSDEIRLALTELAGLLDEISPELVHGDIAVKNLVFDGRSLRLVDWEPALRQMRQGRATLLYTEPYLSARDRAHDMVSTETDKLGFYYVARRLFHGPPHWDGLRSLVMARQQGRGTITPIPESEFLAYSFGQILRLVTAEPESRSSS